MNVHANMSVRCVNTLLMSNITEVDKQIKAVETLIDNSSNFDNIDS